MERIRNWGNMDGLYQFFGKTSFLFIICILTRGSGWATQMPPQTTNTLTMSIKQTVDHALTRNPDVLNDREYLTEADANTSFAIAQIFPTISGTASANIQKDAVNTGNALFNGSSYNQYVAQLHLVQPLYEGGAILAGLSAAKKDRDVHQYTLEIEERDLTVQVIQAFYSVFSNKKVYETLMENEKVEKEALTTTERYYRIGRGQLLDVLQSKAQIALLEPQIATSQNQMRSSVSQLVTLMHESKTTGVNLIGSLASIDTEVVRSLMPVRHKLPEISQGETAISEFDDRAQVTMAPFYPSMSLQANYGQTSTSRSDLFSDYANGWNIGLYLTIPLFSGLSSVFERRSLDSQTAQLEYGQDKLLDTLALNQVTAEQSLDTAANVLKGSREAARLSRASLKEALREFKLQTINYLQLLTSETGDLTAQIAYIQAKGSYINALATYCQTSGIPIQKLVSLLDAQKRTQDD
jgi:outer membrane protein TolC